MLAIFTSDSRSIDLVVGKVSFGPGKNVASRGRLFRDDVLGDIRSHVSASFWLPLNWFFLGT